MVYAERREWSQSLRLILACEHRVDNLRVAAQLMGCVSRQSKFGILLESLDKVYSESVAQTPIFRFLVGAVQAEVVVGKIFCIVGRTLVLELVGVGFVVHSPDEARHRHVCAPFRGVVDSFLLPIAHFVAMVHVNLPTLDAGERRRQIHGYRLGVDFRVAALQLCRVADVKIVGDTAVFMVQRIVAEKHGVHVISVADIR